MGVGVLILFSYYNYSFCLEKLTCQGWKFTFLHDIRQDFVLKQVQLEHITFFVSFVVEKPWKVLCHHFVCRISVFKRLEVKNMTMYIIQTKTIQNLTIFVHDECKGIEIPHIHKKTNVCGGVNAPSHICCKSWLNSFWFLNITSFYFL